jgi:hypothetical protein
MTKIRGIRNKTPGEVAAALDRFAPRYLKDWDEWLAAPAASRPGLFGRILRRWQATRPLAMRRVAAEATHEPPFLDDLVELASSPTGPVHVLNDLTVLDVASRTYQQDKALRALWDLFSGLTTTQSASCVGITKAVLLLTDGRIGPALDSQVRSALAINPPKTAADWIGVLEGVGEDIAEFEARNRPLREVVPERFAHLAYGRLYDMAFGPGASARALAE